MSDKTWPTETDLLGFVDQDLSPEQLERLEDHVRQCGACAKEVSALRTLTHDIAALPAAPPLDLAEHVASVMSRLDEPLPVERRSRRALFAGGLAVAAAASLAIALAGGGGAEEEFVARGTRTGGSLEREVGVELYVHERSLTPLPSGTRIGAHSRLTAGLRNAGSAPAHLLLFAVDARHTVHWIAPAYTSAGTNPKSVAIAPAGVERPLPTAAEFDDLVPGPLRVVAVITREPSFVSDIETLPTAELSLERLRRRFSPGEVREFILFVVP